MQEQSTYVIRVYEDAAGKWRWRMTAPNRKIVADSAEAYFSKANAKRAAEKIVGAAIVLKADPKAAA